MMEPELPPGNFKLYLIELANFIEMSSRPCRTCFSNGASTLQVLWEAIQFRHSGKAKENIKAVIYFCFVAVDEA